MRQWFNGLAIRWKLAIITAATTAVTLLLAGTVTVVLEARTYERQKLEELTAQAKILSANLVAATVFGDVEAATSALAGLAANPEIELGAVYDSDEMLLARYARVDSLLATLPETRPPPRADVRDEAVTVVLPVMQGDSAVGAVYVRARIESAAARLARQAAILLAMGLAGLGLALPASLRLHRTVTNPIEELAAKNTIIETTLANVEHGVLVVDRNGRVNFVNDRVYRIFDIPAGALKAGSDWVGLLKQRLAANPASARVVEEDLSSLDSKEVLRGERDLPDGRVIDYRHVPLPNGGFVRTYTDVTEDRVFQQNLKEAKARAEEADRAKSAFLAAMSHEIRTPMNGVIGIIELLHATALTAEQRQMVEIVRQSGTSLLDVINDILDYSKIEAGRMTVESTPFALGDLMETTTKAISGHTKSKTLNILCSIDPHIDWSMKGDPVRIRQILLNLLGNALKFTEMGSIELSAASESVTDNQQVVLFEVRDTGIGIPADKIDRLFQRFSQADHSTTRRFGGTGLGLSIAKHLVELMGGEIGVRSVPGEGSTFWFRIPFVRVPLAERPGPFAALGNSLAGVRAVVCDRLSRRSSIMNYLQAAGVHTLDATSISQVIELCYRAESEGRLPDMIILSVRLGEDSVSLLSAELAKRRGLQDVKVLLVLPHMSASAAKPLVSANTSAAIYSPVSRRELYEAVAGLAGRAAILERASAQQLEFVPPSLNEAVRQGCLILVAEDNETNQFVVRTQLRRLGYAAEMVSDGQEALNVLRSDPGRYGLLLTDCHMPFLDGYELSRTLRDGERGTARHLPIVALTANALEGEADLCRAAGMDDYLSKPVQLAELDETIRRWLPRAAELRSPVTDQSGQTPSAPHLRPTERAVDAAPINLIMFGELLGNSDQVFLKELLVEFWNSMPTTHRQVCELVAARDEKGLARAAHTAKGSAGSACATALADAYGRVEKAARAGDWSQIDELVDPMEAAFVDVEAYLKELIPANLSSARANYG